MVEAELLQMDQVPYVGRDGPPQGIEAEVKAPKSGKREEEVRREASMELHVWKR